jgi:hypothetical protein
VQHTAGHDCRRGRTVLSIRQDGNYNVVAADSAQRIAIIIVLRDMFGPVVLFVEEGTGCDGFSGDGGDPANGVLARVRHDFCRRLAVEMVWYLGG